METNSTVVSVISFLVIICGVFVCKWTCFSGPGRKLAEEYDYIIVGGGTAGCVLANRLSEDNVSVLLLEAGEAVTWWRRLTMKVPLMTPLLQGTEIDWGYRSLPQLHVGAALINREIPLPSGKVLGGSSAINVMLHVRGDPQDYDLWHTEGATGWNFANVLPYFQRVTAHEEDTLKGAESQGPLKTSTVGASELGRAFIEAGEWMTGKRKKANHGEHLGFSYPEVTISKGIRQSAADAYLYPVIQRKNLNVVNGAYVSRVLFSGKLATGINFTNADGTSHTVRARKEVILSAGTVGSARILLHSGIGPAAQLETHGIKVISNRPTGHNLQDHTLFGLFFEIDTPVSINDAKILSLSEILKYVFEGKGAFASAAAIEAVGYIRTKYAMSNSTRPDIQLYLLSIGSISNEIAREVAHFKRDKWKEYFPPNNNSTSEGFFVGVNLVNPRSRGIIRLHKDGEENGGIAIDPKYLTDPTDMKTLVEGTKFILKMCHKSKSFQKLGARSYLPKFTECLRLRPLSPEDITDEYIECILRQAAVSSYHLVGTCRMGDPADPRAVVDSQLRVIGVERLRVVDASVMPVVTSGNTCYPTMMLAERAADFIRANHRPSI